MKRSEFIQSIPVLTLSAMTDLKTFGNELLAASTTEKMPAIFIGHGSPMNAIEDNAFTRSLNMLGKQIPMPKAILVVSAHWLTNGTYVSATPKPETIYDFGGFPKAMYEVKYEAPGSPEFAGKVKQQISGIEVKFDHHRGFDHGAWTILKQMYPLADVPVFQLSIDYSKPALYHYELAKQLAVLRHKGLLIVGSGNIVHNLGMLNWQNPDDKFDWSIEFDEKVKQGLNHFDHQLLIHYEKMGRAAQLSVPTNDHYLPMMYTIGLQDKMEAVKYIYEGIEMGSISMRCFMVE